MRPTWKSCKIFLLSSERGVVLILSYLAISILLVLQSAYFTRIATDQQLTNRYLYRVNALHMGESGVDATMVQLRALINYPGAPTTPLGAGEYSSTVTPTGYTDNSGIFPATELRIASTGMFPNNAPQPQSRAITAVVHQTIQPFTYAAFIGGKFTVNGDLVTSCFDSRDPLLPPCTLGRVGTNATGPNSVFVSGSTTSAGADFYCGVGCNTAPDTDINLVGPESIGQRRALIEAKYLPQPNIPAALPNEGDLVVPPNSTYTLTAGQHRFNSIFIKTKAKLLASGPVTVFVNGPVDMDQDGQITAFLGQPALFKLYVILPPGPSMPRQWYAPTVVAAVYIYGAVPPDLTIIQPTIVGSVVTTGNITVTGTGTAVYDMALSGLPVGSTQTPPELQVQSVAWANNR